MSEMRHALERAGVAGDPAYLAAVAALRAAGGDVAAALPRLAAAARADLAVLNALIPEAAVRGEAMRRLAQARRDMDGPARAAGPGGGGHRAGDVHNSIVAAADSSDREDGGHSGAGAHGLSAPGLATPPPGGRDQYLADAHPGRVPPAGAPENSDASQEAGGGLRSDDAHTRDAAATPSDPPGGGHVASDAQSMSASVPADGAGGGEAILLLTPTRHVPPAAREPTRRQRAVAIEIKRDLSFHDTFHITERNGARTPIGDLSVAGLEFRVVWLLRHGWVSVQEAHLVKRAAERIKKETAFIPDGAKVRDVLAADDLRHEYEVVKALICTPRTITAIDSDMMETDDGR